MDYDAATVNIDEASTEKCPHCGSALGGMRDAFCPECHEPLDERPPEPRRPGEPVAFGRTIQFGIALIVVIVVWQLTYWLLWAFRVFDVER